jgi:hypothetical protein
MSWSSCQGEVELENWMHPGSGVGCKTRRDHSGLHEGDIAVLGHIYDCWWVVPLMCLTIVTMQGCLLKSQDFASGQRFGRGCHVKHHLSRG